MAGNKYEIFHRMDPYSADLPLHCHDFYELYCPLSGDVGMIVDDRRYALSPGHLLLISPGEMHCVDMDNPRNPVERIVLWIDADYAASLLQAMRVDLGQCPGRNLILMDAETLSLTTGLLFGLLRENQQRHEDSEALCRLMLTQVLIHLSRHISDAAQAASIPSERREMGVLRVYEYIGVHLKEDLSVSRLAELFFMDKNTLTRHFKRLTGMTPGECVRRSRLEAAYAMISAGTGIQEAAAECGFADYSAFYRAFRRMYGTRPSALTGEDDAMRNS